MKKSLLIQSLLAVAAAAQSHAQAAPRPSAPTNVARTCWHCKGEIHPLDVGHAARCSRLAAFKGEACDDPDEDPDLRPRHPLRD
jgi:hypothetical protein